MRLFVYGTLRLREANRFAADLHAHSTHVGRARLRGRLYAFGWCPGLVLSSDERDVVHGDVFALDARTAAGVLARMDEYEGPEYERAEVEVTMDGGDAARCWTYVYRGEVDERERVRSGDWTRRGG